jgi:hypothetical protein
MLTSNSPGNHELYVTEVAYQVFDDFSKYWGDRYLTSNVQALNPATGTWDYIGKTYKYFTTRKGKFFLHAHNWLVLMLS